MESIEVSRKYHSYPANTATFDALKDEMNAKLGTSFTRAQGATLLAQYGQAIATTPLITGIPAHYYTPESCAQAQSQYMSALNTFTDLVAFKVAAILNPFDANGHIKYKQDKLSQYYNPDGSRRHAPYDGFLDNVRENATLKNGDIIDRYGPDSGRFAAPYGTPYAARSIEPGGEVRGYHRYKVLKDIPVESGTIAPWFAQQGGGTQYRLPMTIQQLISGRYIDEIFN